MRYNTATVGKVYGRLTLLRREDAYTIDGKSYRAKWECLCSCGKKTVVEEFNIKSGNTRSCGCLRPEAGALYGGGVTTHGMTGTPEYDAWKCAKNRCNNPYEEGYIDYGARGIKVSDEWQDSFESFYSYIGPKPEPKHRYSLDRIDNDGNYERGNVRWATASEQVNNRNRK